MEKEKSSNKWSLLLLICIYGLAHGAILLVNGIYWDDWAIFNANSHILISKFDQVGIPWIGYLHSFLLSFSHAVVMYRILIFFCYLLSGIFLYYILLKIKKITPTARLFIVLLFMTFPVNNARVALIDTPYAVCYFSFFLAFWLISVKAFKGNIILRIISLALFFFSFSTNSLLMFYVIVIFYLLYLEEVKIYSIIQLIKFAFKHIDFILLPIVFWIFKNKFWAPYGLYTNYNKVTPEGLSHAVSLVPVAFTKSVIDVFKLSFEHLNKAVAFELILGVLLTIMIIKYVRPAFQQEIKIGFPTNITFFLLGLLLFALAVYPYLVIPKMPNLHDWDSRHQLLVPLGASLFIYYGITILFNLFRIGDKVKIFIFSLLTAVFIFTNFLSYIHYQQDWYKQAALMDNFKQNRTIVNHSTFIFRDQTLGLNANHRLYRFYEYTGMMKATFHDEKRFGENEPIFRRKKLITSYKRFFNEHYSLSDYTYTKPIYLVTINKGKLDLSNEFLVMKLRYQELFDKKSFNKNIRNAIILDTSTYK